MKRRLVRLGLGSLVVLAFSIAAAPASAKTVTKTGRFTECREVGTPILDFTQTEVLFAVNTPKRAIPPAAKVLDVKVGLRATHANTTDLDVLLSSPTGKVVPLFLGRGDPLVNNNDLGSGATSCSGTLTSFDDAAATRISAGASPFNGPFKPEQPLSALNGGPAKGGWRILVIDNANMETGTLHSASLTVTYSYKQKKKKRR